MRGTPQREAASLKVEIFPNDLALLIWIAYIKSMGQEFKHIVEKENPILDMLSHTRYEGEEEMIDEKDIGKKFYSISSTKREGLCLATSLGPFLEES